MSQPPVENDTDFRAEPHLLVDKDGEKLCLIVKATWELADGKPHATDGTFTIAPKDRRRGIRAADFPWGKPEVASIRYPSDLCVRKPGTEVLLVATAHAPGGKPQKSFEAGVRLGKASKVVRVCGTRVWLPDGRGMSEPQPLLALEMRYDYAFGGTDLENPAKPVSDPRNPVGRGRVANLASLQNRPAPQIEDPQAPIQNAEDLPKPAGLGPIGRHYDPRRALFGTYDGDWVEKRSPLPPRDFDDRANFSAPAELIMAPTKGGEEGALSNLTPGGGNVPFVLPKFRVAVRFAVRGKDPVDFELFCDTIVLDTMLVQPRRLAGGTGVAAGLTLEMVGRAAIAAPRRLADAKITVKELRT